MEKEQSTSKITDMSATELFNQMTDTQKDEVYRKVWAEHVVEDITSRIEDYYAVEDYDLTDAELEDKTKEAARLYVYESKYDCNRSYWDNLDTLIRRIVLPNSKRKG